MTQPKMNYMRLTNKRVMKLLQIKFVKTSNAFIAWLLAILGFASSCDKLNPQPDEYGTPSAKFIINGKIESASSNTPIKNILVIMQRDSSLFLKDTAFSDNEGNYQVDYRLFPTDTKFDIQFQDTDGVENGSYVNLDTVVEFKDPKFTNGDGHWYSGEVTKELNIKLNPKK